MRRFDIGGPDETYDRELFDAVPVMMIISCHRKLCYNYFVGPLVTLLVDLDVRQSPGRRAPVPTPRAHAANAPPSRQEREDESYEDWAQRCKDLHTAFLDGIQELNLGRRFVRAWSSLRCAPPRNL